MIKISYHPYILSPRMSLSSLSETQKEGALLKVEWDGVGAGYADLHPLVEFGEASLLKHLEGAAQKKFSKLFQQSLWFAERDIQARFEKKSILSFGERIKNNYLISDLQQISEKELATLQTQGFETVKVKAGREPRKEAQILNSFKHLPLRWRLDFNLSLQENPFRYFLSELDEEFLHRIEYVEDPFPYDLLAWQELNELIPLALDMEIDKVPWLDLKQKPFSALVIKPSRTAFEDLWPFLEKWDLKITVTSAMDHTVGQLHALAYAQELKKEYGARVLNAGCLTQFLFKEDAFINRLHMAGPYLNSENTPGIGFEDLLQELVWTPLVSL